ncbi:MAG: hypothetical protein FJY92_02030 [Candidatus Hydrogenedentes bacterium]|nr:hypothetical protein [Candidatus Hydrogenedentota bacterium]
MVQRSTRLALVFAAACIPSALAKNEYLLAAGLMYPAITSTQLYSCSLCHSSGDYRNPYGRAFETNGHNFRTIEGIDSDVDGFSNVTEIGALTWPGNPLDFPMVMGTIAVKKPNGGGGWTLGTKAVVTWSSTGTIGDNIAIELWRDGKKVKTLKAMTPDDGKQKVLLKDTLPTGTGFRIRVKSIANPAVANFSPGTFTIVPAGP